MKRVHLLDELSQGRGIHRQAGMDVARLEDRQAVERRRKAWEGKGLSHDLKPGGVERGPVSRGDHRRRRDGSERPPEERSSLQIDGAPVLPAGPHAVAEVGQNVTRAEEKGGADRAEAPDGERVLEDGVGGTNARLGTDEPRDVRDLHDADKNRQGSDEQGLETGVNPERRIRRRALTKR